MQITLDLPEELVSRVSSLEDKLLRILPHSRSCRVRLSRNRPHHAEKHGGATEADNLAQGDRSILSQRSHGCLNLC